MAIQPAAVPRDYPRLFSALNEVLRIPSAGGREEDVLSHSFEHGALGLGADKALLLLVEGGPPWRLRRLCSHGLPDGEIEDGAPGHPVAGMSAKLIHDVAAGGPARVVDALDHSVLCAPVCDGARALAVLYFQKRAPAGEAAYSASDAVWVEGYAAALGQALGPYLRKQRGQRERSERTPAAPGPDGPAIIGDSVHAQALRRQLHDVYIPAAAARDPDPILILGEKGTGKDLVARYLHAHSARRHQPFVVVNCADITDEMAAARFFGHKKGAFTGAAADEPGFFRAAHRGFLFLDEIAELSRKAQATLLRALENHTVVPVGETREVAVDAQVLLATNREPVTALADGSLKEDLYDRFKTQVIRVEPLREKAWDIPLLVQHFIAHHERRTQKKTLGLTPEAIGAMVSYRWPGNVRELARVCSLLITHAPAGARIDHALLAGCYPDLFREDPNPRAGPMLWPDVPLRKALRDFERELILSRLQRHNWNMRLARESLGLPKTTFQRYATGLGITVRGRTMAATED
ncbi:MAG TPA: sigma 54-interacting transcriptional regulator [Vicinamibacteria bacterium]